MGYLKHDRKSSPDSFRKKHTGTVRKALKTGEIQMIKMGKFI
jgi:hypothetical protein